MERKIQYGTGVIPVPALATERIPPDLIYDRVLLLLCADPSISERSLSERLDLPIERVREAVSYWIGEGILISEQTEEIRKEETKHLLMQPIPPGLPDYTPEQIADIIRCDDTLAGLLDLCQKEIGKTFTEHETAQILALYNSYGLDAEYLLLLFALCKKREKRSVGYAVRTAVGLYEDGIRTAPELTEKIKQMDRLSDATAQIRKMFGIGDRALTAKERNYIEDWTENWRLQMEVIQSAFEITVDTIGKPKFPYVNKILSEWHRRGIRTVEEAKRTQQDSGNAGPQGNSAREKKTGSFETEEFMNAALSRSFPDQKE